MQISPILLPAASESDNHKTKTCKYLQEARGGIS
jgi:hypothetical protein